ncbi:MAG: hypothetical protein ACHQ1D_01710 [Nitrososphaerales archaeon]
MAKPKRKYESLYSGLFGPKKNYLEDVPLYGPKKTYLDSVQTGWSPGQFADPQALADRQLINKAKNAPANSEDYFRYNEGELSPTVQAAIDREMKRNQYVPEHRKRNKVKGLNQVPIEPQPKPRPEMERPNGPTDLIPEGPPKPATTAELTFPEPTPPKLPPKTQPPPIGTGGLRPIQGATGKPQAQPVPDDVPEEDDRNYIPTEKPKAEPLLRSDLFGGGRPKTGIDPDRFTMGPWDRPEPNIAGADPDYMSMYPEPPSSSSTSTTSKDNGPEIPEGVVTADTKEIRARIMDASDQKFTPRNILSPEPKGPRLAPIWDGGRYEKIPTKVDKYGEPLPNVPKLDPTHPITPNRHIDENIDPYQKGHNLPPEYDIEQGPEVGPRERVTPTEMYQEVRPGVWELREAPTTPDYEDVNIGKPFEKPIPEQTPIEKAPSEAEKDYNFNRLGEPETVGQMRDRVWRPNIREADYTDIQGPEKMAQLKNPELGNFKGLDEWDKGKERPFVRAPYAGYRNVGVAAGMADVSRSIFSLGKDFQGAAGKAVGEEADRMERFNARQDQREMAIGQLNQAERAQRLAEQNFKFGLQKAISEQGLQIRGQDLDYIKAGAQLSMQEFQTRLQERMGHNADRLRFNDSLISEAQNYNQADQNLQAKNIEARQADRGLKATYTQLNNAATRDKLQAQQTEDRFKFDRWAKTQDLTQDQYTKALNAWNIEQQAKYGQQALGLEAQQFNVGTDLKKFDQDLSKWDKTMGYSAQNFNDSLNRWREGRANHQDYQVLRFHQEKQDIDQGNTIFNQKLDVWDKTLGHKDAKLRTDIDRWRTGADDHYKFLDEKRLRFGLNEKEQRDYDTLGIQKWQIEQSAKDANFDSNLQRWDKGLDLHKFMSTEERERFKENNETLYRADANAIAKYGQDADLWEKYNSLPSSIRKDEAMADNYMNWYAQEVLKMKGDKQKAVDPLKLSEYYDKFNSRWTGSQAWKDYEEAGKSFQKIVAAPPTGFGDMSAIYGFIKAIDPKTGVKEGERDFAISAMGWLKKAEASGALNGLPSGIVRKIQRALDGEIMQPADREALADAAFEATNVPRQMYYNQYAQHVKTWKSSEVLRDNTDRIMTQPDYFGETDKFGNKLAEPGWKKVMRDKYKNFKPKRIEPKPKGKPLPKPSIDYNNPDYDPTNDFQDAIDNEPPA